MERVSYASGDVSGRVRCLRSRKGLVEVVKLSLALLIITASVVCIAVKLPPLELWLALLSACIGFLAPAPVQYET